MSSQHQSKFAFFKQSIWMVVATFGGGLLMMGVHTLAGHTMKDEEYAAFFALLRLFIWLGIPSAGLQMVFAKQAAAAIDDKTSQELSATVRGVLKTTFYLWLLIAVFAVIWGKWILASLKITNPAALYLTIMLVLFTLWLPVLKGLLQGKHQFAGLGWLQIVDGIGRFGGIAVILFLFHGQSAGGILACIIGQIFALSIGFWLTRTIWRGPGRHFVWRTWLNDVTPLTLGLGAVLFISAADAVFVKSVFNEAHCKIYGAAALTGFAIMQFVAPIASVMFPKIVQSVARAEKTDAMRLTLGITTAVGAMAALVCTVFPELPLMIMYFKSPQMLAAAPLVPWYAWALLPLTVANVLVTNLLARQRYAIVPWIVPIAIAFFVTLRLLVPQFTRLPEMDAFKHVIQIYGLFSLMLAIVSVVFTWRKPAVNASGPGSAAGR